MAAFLLRRRKKWVRQKYPPSVSHHEFMMKQLHDPEFASEYLNACLEENDKELFLKALRDVLEAQGGMTKIAKAAKVNRVSLYKMLQAGGNPGFDNILKLLQAAGIRFYVKPKKTRPYPKAA